MGHNIKELKPSRQSRYKQGYVDTTSCTKLFESQRAKPIIYRSSFELRFIHWLENSERIAHWGSECVGIPYNIRDEHHTYYPDFVVETIDGERWLVEIKPHSQTTAPKQKNSYAWREYIKNMHKWRAAKRFCEDRGIKFYIITEKTLDKLN